MLFRHNFFAKIKRKEPNEDCTHAKDDSKTGISSKKCCQIHGATFSADYQYVINQFYPTNIGSTKTRINATKNSISTKISIVANRQRLLKIIDNDLNIGTKPPNLQFIEEILQIFREAK